LHDKISTPKELLSELQWHSAYAWLMKV
jgi:hypothetical protein